MNIQSRQANTSLSFHKWMNDLDDKTKINQIVIPGSHDAGMSETDHCDIGAGFNKGIVLTQSLNIKDQLLAGARYFDIRVDYDHNELVTYHRSGNSGCNGQKLSTIFDQSISFIKENQSETFFLKFSHIRKNRGKEVEIKERIEQFLSNISYRPYLFKHSDYQINLATLGLGECRGKIILLFDYPEFISSKESKFRYHDWTNVNSTEIELNGKQFANITVYDSYSNTVSLDKMKEDQLRKLNEFGGLGKPYLFLLSWTLTPDIGTFFGGTIEELASKANAELENVISSFLKQPAQVFPNIVYVDYVNTRTSEFILSCNRKNQLP